MNYTSNYNLKKPESTDFYNIGNENDNMDTIDAELKEHSDSIDSLKNPIYTTAEEVAEPVSGELFTTFFGKVKKAITTLINHIAAANPHSGSAPTSHSHSQSDVSGLSTALNGKANANHNHSASNITSGTLSADRLPSPVVTEIPLNDYINSVLNGASYVDDGSYVCKYGNEIFGKIKLSNVTIDAAEYGKELLCINDSYAAMSPSVNLWYSCILHSNSVGINCCIKHNKIHTLGAIDLQGSNGVVIIFRYPVSNN